jgi:protein phosphatase
MSRFAIDPRWLIYMPPTMSPPATSRIEGYLEHLAELATDWALLDAEIMPWSAKAEALIRDQHAPAGAAARVGLSAAGDALRRALDRGAPVEPLLEQVGARLEKAEAFAAVVRRYAWPVAGIDDLKIAPFHLLASEGQVHGDQLHRWHLERIGRLAEADPLFQARASLAVDLEDDAEEQAAVAWWLGLTAQGGGGMVVKPEPFVARGRRGLVQPADKCRGREYLRLIYGPDYDVPKHLDRLRERGLGAKRSLALRAFALGLERFVARAPLRRVHECVFAVLALESGPVDPRLQRGLRRAWPDQLRPAGCGSARMSDPVDTSIGRADPARPSHATGRDPSASDRDPT